MRAALFALAASQIRVLSPPSLRDSLGNNGNVMGTTSVFGTPYYGDRVYGQLVYGSSRGEAHCREEDYDIVDPHFSESQEAQLPEEGQQRLAKIFVVRRGKCTFVTKVKVAEAKGADAVIFVDEAGSARTEEDIHNIIVADDGYGVNVKIPSILVDVTSGEKLIQGAIDGGYRDPVMVELAWDIPVKHVVRMDLWVHPGGSDFLDEFREKAVLLKWDLDFIPHWPIFSLPQDFNNQCSHGSKYCMEDPDGAGPITGKMVVEEVIRKWCIKVVHGEPDPSNKNNRAVFSPKWWEYVKKFHQTCIIGTGQEIKDANRRFGPVCAKNIGREVGVNEGEVEKCILEQGSEILERQIIDRAWSPTALRINGWRYSGPHDAGVVARAICSGYVIRPKACDVISESIPLGPMVVDEGNRTDFSTIMGVLLGSLVVLALALHCHRRSLVKDVRNMYQHDVRSEVKSHMGQYASLRA